MKDEKFGFSWGLSYKFCQLQCQYLYIQPKARFWMFLLFCFVFHLNEFEIENHVFATAQSKGN